jgi:hypothetical protein
LDVGGETVQSTLDGFLGGGVHHAGLPSQLAQRPITLGSRLQVRVHSHIAARHPGSS